MRRACSTHVITASNGDNFVADGHGVQQGHQTNDRIVKLSKDGAFIMAWGKHGSAPGEFDVPHSLALDSAGRLYVGDRSNNRIQIFDQNGKFIAAFGLEASRMAKSQLSFH